MTKDQFIFEKLAREGECWHEWKQIYDSGGSRCIHCGKHWPLFPDQETQRIIQRSTVPDFTTWEGFGWMWERVIEKEWFFEFFKKLPVNTFWRAEIAQTMHLNNPIRLRDELAKYFGWEGCDEIHTKTT
ncbi:MAG: hypothetical protein WCX99_03045 [Candidatus Paceibacterota bacterium]